MCALADALGSMVRDLSGVADISEEDAWEMLFDMLDGPPVEEYVRKRNQ